MPHAGAPGVPGGTLSLACQSSSAWPVLRLCFPKHLFPRHLLPPAPWAPGSWTPGPPAPPLWGSHLFLSRGPVMGITPITAFTPFCLPGKCQPLGRPALPGGSVLSSPLFTGSVCHPGAHQCSLKRPLPFPAPRAPPLLPRGSHPYAPKLEPSLGFGIVRSRLCLTFWFCFHFCLVLSSIEKG